MHLTATQQWQPMFHYVRQILNVLVIKALFTRTTFVPSEEILVILSCVALCNDVYRGFHPCCSLSVDSVWINTSTPQTQEVHTHSHAPNVEVCRLKYSQRIQIKLLF